MAFGDPRGLWLFIVWAAFFLVVVRKLRRRRVVLSIHFLIRPLADRLSSLGRRFRVLRRLAMLLFILAAGLTAAAGTAPLWSGGHPPLHEMVLVDVSPSMGITGAGGTRLDLLAARLREHLAALRRADRVTLVLAGPRAILHRDLDPAAAAAILEGIERSDVPADIDGATVMAVVAARARRPDHLLILTDRPARWRESPRWSGLAALAPRVLVEGAARPNNALTAVDLSWNTGPGRYDLLVAVRKGRWSPTGPVVVRVLGNGKPVAVAEIEPRPGEEKPVVLRDLPLGEGLVEVVLDQGGDFAGDDRVATLIGARKGVRVLAVTAGNRFLEGVVATAPGIEGRIVAPGESLPDDPAAVYVFDGVVPEGPLPPLAVFIRPDRPPDGIGIRGQRSSMGFVSGETGEPLLRGVDQDDLALKGFQELEAGGEYRSILETEGSPLVLLRADPARRWAVLSFDPTETVFAYSASYPVLMANLIRWAAARLTPEVRSMRAGDDLLLPAAAAGGTVVLPGGTRRPLPADADGAVRFGGGSAAGAYRILAADGRELGAFHLNVLDDAVAVELDADGYGGPSDRLPEGLPRFPPRIFLAPLAAVLALCLLAAERIVSRRQMSRIEEET